MFHFWIGRKPTGGIGIDLRWIVEHDAKEQRGTFLFITAPRQPDPAPTRNANSTASSLNSIDIIA
ncbi:hypothetical protein C8J25_103353 [Sphingomonas faeni]|uniref:Uncharacterized protein n=1 Tax=Sphingomonas faeni TaxID=185950 RepID=A0A2T5U806_9SPHN|nr:hypothetical protein C8J25_103353 [Sphingomonas faeni]